MKQFVLSMTALVAVFCTGCMEAGGTQPPSDAVATPQESPATEPATEEETPETISVASFRQGNVIGFLGHPLGTVVRVTGNVVDENYVRSKAEASETLLEIKTVNGETLNPPVIFAMHFTGASIEEPGAGEAFDYMVHEWGEFNGVVVNRHNIAHDGFYYRRELTIHEALGQPAAK